LDIEETEGFVKEKLENFPDVRSHTQRVRKYALFIAKQEKADLKIVEAAALLHDIGYSIEGFSNHAKNSVTVAKKFLEKSNFDNLEYLLNAIEHGKDPKTIEAKIILDADALDRIGPIGIIRMTIHFFRDEKIIDTKILAEKVKNLIEMSIQNLYTETAKEIAKSNLLSLKDFFEVLNIQLEPNLYRLTE